MTRNLTFITGFVFLFSCFFSSSINAQSESECATAYFNDTYGDYVYISENHPYRIITNNVGTILPGMGTEDLSAFVATSISYWSELTARGTFRYKGSISNLKPNENWDLAYVPNGKCDRQEDFDTLIYVNSEYTGSLCAEAQGYCCHQIISVDGFTYRFNCEKSAISIYPNSGCANQKIYDINGDLRITSFLRILAHEFGHLLNLGHTDQPGYSNISAKSIMSRESPNVVYDFFASEYDVICNTYNSNFVRQKELNPYYRTTLGSYTSSETQISTNGVISVSSGINKISGNWQFSWLTNLSYSYIRWWISLSQWYTNASTLAIRSPQISESVFREDENKSRHIYTYYNNGNSTWDSIPILRTNYTTQQNSYNLSSAINMKFCSDSSFLTCNPLDFYGGYVPSIAWDDRINKTVFAFLGFQGSFPIRGIVYISYGYNNDYTMNYPKIVKYPYPNEFGSQIVKSFIKPSVVCKMGQANGKDCILIYVDNGNYNPLDFGVVKLIRYSSQNGQYPDNLSLVDGPFTIQSSFFGTNVKARTGNPVAAWYDSNSSNFNVVIRDINSNQMMKIFRSTNGQNWILDTSFGMSNNISFYSSIGPSSISFWNSGNMISYAR